MSKYEIGKPYLFVHATSKVTLSADSDFKMETPSSMLVGIDSDCFRNIGIVGVRKFNYIEFKELICTEIRESKCSYGGEQKYEGYLFKDSENNIFSIQYPTASYSQTSDKGDYVASRYDEKIEESSDKNYEELEKSGYLRQYILFSYLLEQLEDSIKESFQSKEKMSTTYTYYKDYMGQLERTHKEPIPDKTITINIFDNLFETMRCYLFHIPEGYVVNFLVERFSFSKQKNEHPYLFTRVIVEKGSIMKK